MQSIDQVQWPGWNVVRLIGRGSFGAVYEIQRDVFGETERAALKVITIPENGADIDDLRVEGYDDESITSRFQSYLEDIVKEYSTMAKMKGHPNVVYCDDVKYVQHDDGIGWDIYIKMELLTPIMKCLDQVENEQSVVDLGIAMCNALVLCKERSIVHRDIKPQNIFVSQDGTFKLGDFGIAKTAERTTSGTKVGTYKYMAPEVYNNRPYGPAADQYSLGLVMYWLMNDRRTPFSPKKATATEEDLARKRRFDGEQIPPPAHGSKQLQAIVLRACAYDPKDRFASAAEMLEALKALKNGSASPAVAVPMGAAAAVAGGAAADVAAEEMTTGTVGTVGRRRPNTEEEATVGAFGAGAAYASRQQGQSLTNQNAGQQNGGPGRVQPAQQGSRQYAGASAIPPQNKTEEKKKKRGIAAWIAIAAGLVVVIGGILLLTLGKGKDSGNQSDTRAALNNHTSESTTTSPTEPEETLPVQLDWAEWADELPDHVTGNDYTIEERTLYRSRNLETTSSTTSDKMDGWELYDTATGNGDYGAWSDWSATAVSASDTRDVETQTRYRYSDKETTTGSSSSKSGWTLEDTTYSWGDYGAWSDWSATAVSKSDSRQVETQTRYRYRDKETTTSTSSSMSGWTQYNSTTSWGDWGSWSSWSTDYVSANDGRQVETKTQYSYRDKSTTSSSSSSLSGWTLYDSDFSYGSWSDWSDNPVSENSQRQVETRDVQTGTRYHMGHYCTGYTGDSNQYKSANWKFCDQCDYHDLGWFDSLNLFTNEGDGFYKYWPGGSMYRCSNTCFLFCIMDRQNTYKTQYRYRAITTTYYFYRWGDWTSYNDSYVSSNSNRDVRTRTVYRYRTRSQSSTYYYYRWKAWSSWSTNSVSGNDNREVQTATYYRYRDRASIPTYHFSRWKDWSSWSETSYSQSSTRKVETATFYRYRDRVTQTTYYFQRWTDWSDYTESPVDENDTVEVETKTQFRYKSKET